MNKIAQAKNFALEQASVARKRASLARLDVESASIVEDLQNLSEIGRNHPDPVFRKAAAKNWQKILAALGILGGTGAAATLGAKALNRQPKDFDNVLYSEEEAFAPAPEPKKDKEWQWDMEVGRYTPNQESVPQADPAFNAYANFFRNQGLSEEEIGEFERKMSAVSDDDIDEYERARQVAGGGFMPSDEDNSGDSFAEAMEDTEDYAPEEDAEEDAEDYAPEEYTNLHNVASARETFEKSPEEPYEPYSVPKSPYRIPRAGKEEYFTPALNAADEGAIEFDNSMYTGNPETGELEYDRAGRDRAVNAYQEVLKKLKKY